ncbi:MMPL family transporter [Cellulomonas fimi]|uniref:MmpL domain protein n=1 Tax=Cellulomonas fimi (strain ATCC 484 / DSM 20113 / JCM 1341 / CCUG 24087 / LMG 16345 / NBRC 15513 / NCIMB 8980 / NCTC 7547 / NRS-133) TaxID=590998 RepID=F4H5M3_CELFA|nr:MMPL family transporter [Cellulomonas fimi]AEE44347.1 MmpL domain protein [Cellulomonas fimi ATCC 484]NNH08128.1 MMPL family transporter [Cellulomonas fimi]VEH26173.1 Membrane transport protein mmpL8 [Cellulomonas fimi]
MPVIALARFSARHRWLVLAAWTLVAVALLAASRVLGPSLADDVSVPGSDSAQATAVAETVAAGSDQPAEDQPAADQPAADEPAADEAASDRPAAGDSDVVASSVLVASTDPVAGHQQAVDDLAAALRAVDGVEEVTGPTPATPPEAGAGRPAGATAVGADTRAVTLRVRSTEDVDRDALADAVDEARADGLDVGVGYPLLRDLEPGMESRTSEVVGIVAAVVILLVALGSALAMGVPVVSALVGVAAGLGTLQLLGQAVSVPTVVPTLATMIGLGVGIDYALFQVVRHRDALRGTPDRVEAAAVTAATSGSAVAFAGVTVAVAISALAVTGVDFMSWLGFGTAVVVAVVLLCALTFTPALLAAAGPGVVRRRDRAALRAHRSRARAAAVAVEGRAGSAPSLGGGTPSDGSGSGPVPPGDGRTHQAPPDDGTALDASRWSAFARLVTRRPWWSVVAGLLVLGVLAAPAATMELGQSSDGDRPVGSERRTTYDLTSAHLGEGANATLLVAVALDPAATAPDDPRLTAVATQARDVDGVVAVAPPQLAADGTAATLRLTPEAGPADGATAQVVEELRALPGAEGADVHVGGQTAVRLDLSDRISERLPWLIAAAVGLAALLLVVAFRSLVLPLKAALMDLLSVVAAYGVVTAVFSWGWGATLLGLDGPVAIDAYVPMMLFAVLFGLSMDYEVFLLSSVREHWHATGDADLAIHRGLASTGRVITAAAAIMLAVFGSFVRVDDPTIKVFGVGLAVAVAVDATLVRCVLGPAVMALTGRWSWWLPRRLDRVLPHVSL